MVLIARVLDPEPVATLDDYRSIGGGRGIDAARAMDPADVVALVHAAGIRGRGGAGFPTGVKWQTVAANASPLEPSSVVVNAAEGEPGSFKDRELLRRNPYRTLEGACIAAHAVGASKIFVGMKRTATSEIARVRAAIDELGAAGWFDGLEIALVEGPPEYLLGEETALCEVVDGRLPFPRVAPPYRRGVDEVVEHADDIDTGSGSAAHVELAAPGGASYAPPALVDNVETLAHVTLACAHGDNWFREVGTLRSPGSVVCTVSGATQRTAVGEVTMGTPLRAVIDEVGGGVAPGRQINAVLQGVSAALIVPEQLDTPLTWEDMAEIGSGLGASAFIVFDDAIDPLSIARAASRFLAVESCGQCTPCKQDGLAIADALDAGDVEGARRRLVTVADSARCSLATQHQVVVSSILDRLATLGRGRTPATVLPLHDVHDGEAVIDAEQGRKQPDWSYGETWSGASPADLLDEHRIDQTRRV